MKAVEPDASVLVVMVMMVMKIVLLVMVIVVKCYQCSRNQSGRHNSNSISMLVIRGFSSSYTGRSLEGKKCKRPQQYSAINTLLYGKGWAIGQSL